jgi:hypothetical protein
MRRPIEWVSVPLMGVTVETARLEAPVDGPEPLSTGESVCVEVAERPSRRHGQGLGLGPMVCWPLPGSVRRVSPRYMV